MNRRSFIEKSVLTSAVTLSFPYVALSKDQIKLRIAVIGLGQRSEYAFRSLHREQITALCDVDTRTFNQSVEKRRMKQTPDELWPRAKRFEDYRELFEYPEIFDAVWIATPDHHHFPAAIRAIKAGKAVYCEKPLAWSVSECQQLADAARKYEVATQMGNQGMANVGWRMGRTYYEAGLLGDILEVHTYTGTRFDRPLERYLGSDPVPSGLNWDLWIGPAPERPYLESVYHPFEWRGVRDFGNGALGDWSCHLMNGFYKILEPDYPSSVECLEKREDTGRTFASGYKLQYEYPAKEGRLGFTSYWYNGTCAPPRPAALEVGRDLGGIGSYLVGTKGTLWLKGGYVESPILLPETFRRKVGRIECAVPHSNHVEEFLKAAKGITTFDAPLSHFGYSGPMTAGALLGTIATRISGKLEYNPDSASFSNNDLANIYLQRKDARAGWYL